MVEASNDIHIFDRCLLGQRKNRIQPDAMFLKDWAQRESKSRLQDIKRNFTNRIDLTVGEEEIVDINAESCDLITSCLNLHNVNDLPGLLVQIKRSLKADGLFLGSMLGGETLFELREILGQAELEIKGGVSPRVHPFATKQDMGALLQRAGFALPVVDSEIITVSYDNMFKLMHDLRGMGESNVVLARDKSYAGRELFVRAAELYQEKFAEEDGRIVATFEILFLSGWSPHESQQKPLQPGSATGRLADVLQTNETKL